LDLKILYASYVNGSDIPPYIRFTLKCLSDLGLSVVYITNQRDIENSALDFLKQNQVELFLTPNKGYDFGMWRRYLASTPNRDWNRLCLINDSIVYYQNRFEEYFKKAESSDADMISLTENHEISYHLQSFFLYLKPAAIQALETHFTENPDKDEFYEIVTSMEIGLSSRMLQQNLKLLSLFKTTKSVLFAYSELIEQGAGFMKKKLLEIRFTRAEKLHFFRHKAHQALFTNYLNLIQNQVDPSFDFESLKTYPPKLFSRFKDRLLFLNYSLAYFFLYKPFLILKNKINPFSKSS